MHVKMETFSSPTNFGELLHLPDNCKEEAIGSFFSTVARQNVWGGGGGRLGRAKPRLSGRKKTRKIFEIFIPEIAANASNFKN